MVSGGAAPLQIFVTRDGGLRWTPRATAPVGCLPFEGPGGRLWSVVGVGAPRHSRAASFAVWTARGPGAPWRKVLMPPLNPHLSLTVSSVGTGPGGVAALLVSRMYLAHRNRVGGPPSTSVLVLYRTTDGGPPLELGRSASFVERGRPKRGTQLGQRTGRLSSSDAGGHRGHHERGSTPGATVPLPMPRLPHAAMRSRVAGSDSGRYGRRAGAL
jgi:hypothetical protein